MKKLLVTLAATISVMAVFAQNYSPTDNGSEIKFAIKNFAFTVTGRFNGLKGKISFNPANLSVASFATTLDAASVNTGNDSRDAHLKKAEYLDVTRYPVISFVSTKITNTAGGTLIMDAKITIKAVTKTVSFPFKAIPKTGGYLFEGEFKLNRRDFDVGGNSMVMSDNLTVSLSVFVKKD
ncbi:MAG: YceI family protein [Ferruginibacter sp.]